jgi:hypothetical protein
MTFADDLILDESRAARFEPGLPNLTSYLGCSTLSGRNVDLHSLGGPIRTVEAGRSKSLKQQPKVASADRDALKAAVVAAGGTLVRSNGWLLTVDRAGHLRHRRAVQTRPQRDRTAYLAHQQARHEAEWARTIHRCACGCQTEIGPGNYDRPRSFAPGHSSRSAHARQQVVYRAAVRQEKADLRTSRRVRMPGAAAVEDVVAA